ncbi:MAG: 6-bladed beta-propeller [Verrucomicrobia bacterium]|nr:6-bladed beta-propeller [Verrucomicrobiota bacterium]
MTTRLLACLGFVACSALAHPDDIALPVRHVAAALPAAPLGEGAWRFEIEAGWAKIPEGTALGPTHGGIVVDKAGLIYVSSDGPAGVLVFSPDGKLRRTLPSELKGIHGMMIREEGGKEFIYAAHVVANEVLKISTDGAIVWRITCPTQSGLYLPVSEFKPKKAGDKPKSTMVGHDGREYIVDGFKPTAVTVGPDGRIYVADGYGASVIHEYTADRKWTKVIGSRGEGDGQFKTCHGIALDTRSGQPLLLVCDRENKRLVHLDLDGKFVRTLTTGMRRPCAVSIKGDYAAVAELEGRVVIVDKAGKIVATLGDNPDQKQWAAFRLAPEFWKDGIFIAPHGVSWDATGNLFVQDWNYMGRVTKLRKATKGLAMVGK